MATGLIDIMKRASIGATEASKPCDLRYGTVTSISPLKVRITNQFVLTEPMLIVPKHLTDYEVKVEGYFNFEDPHNNGPHKGSGKLTIKNALETGDKVALLRQTGGQFYFILDKL